MSEVVANLAESFLFSVFLAFFLEPKKSRKHLWAGIVLTTFLLFLNISVSERYSLYNVYSLLADLVISAVFWKCFLKGSLTNFLFGFALIYSGLYLSVYFSIFIFTLLEPGNFLASQSMGTVYRVGLLVMSKLLLLIYIAVILHFRRKYRYHKRGIAMLCYSMFPIAIFVFFILLTGTLTEMYRMEPALGVKMIGAMVGIHFIVIISIYLSIHAVLKAEEEYNVEKLNYMLDVQRESLERYIAQERELYRLRHELEHKFFTVQYLLEKDRKKEGLDVMRQTIHDLCGDAGDLSVSQNIVDTVVANIERKAEADGVKMQKEIRFSDDAIMDLADLCVLLGNLLDNAVEAAAKSVEKQVRVNVKEELSCLFIRVSNTYSRENSDVKNFISRKEGSGLKHGYGMRHIREIVGRYEGEFETRDEEEWFYADVIIYDRK